MSRSPGHVPTDRKTLAAVGTLLLVHAAALAWGSVAHSPTRDEVAHLAAGISHWQLGKFDLYRVNPPLARTIATIPVVLTGPATDWSDYATDETRRSDFSVGRDFVDANGSNTFWYLTLARWACIPFSLIGATVCWLWASRLYGPSSGLIALGLWCICPNVIAHGQFITPDMAATSLGVAAAYGFWRWLRAPTWPHAAWAGVLLGLAELTKTTWVILLPLWPVLWILWSLFGSATAGRSERLRRFGQIAVILLLAVYLLNLGYLFEGSFTPLGKYRFLSGVLTGNDTAGQPDLGPHNRFSDSWLGALPVPVPRNYLQGIDYQKQRFERQDWSYLRGQWRSVGWYYYYAYAMLIKIPLGTWLVGIAAALITLVPRRWLGCKHSTGSPEPTDTDPQRQITWRDEGLVLAVAAAVLLLVSSHTGFNRHLRYVLPAFPFLFVWASRIGQYADFEWLLHSPKRILSPGPRPVLQRSAPRLPRAVAVFVAGAVVWSAVSSFSAYPHSLSYFNELVGGPRGGHWHLASSNVDWGQDLFFVKAWYDKHPEARPFHFAYRVAIADPKLAGIEYEPVPIGPVMNRPHAPITRNWPWGDFSNNTDQATPKRDDPADQAVQGPRPGWYAIDRNLIHRRNGRYEYFLEFEPVATVGYSTNIYYITRDDADRVRRRLGMEELEDETRESR